MYRQWKKDSQKMRAKSDTKLAHTIKAKEDKLKLFKTTLQ